MNRVEIVESLERRTYFSTLSFSRPGSFAAGINPSDVVTANLTGNGSIDVVASDFGSASIAVLRGNGNGTFQSPVFYPVGNSPESLAVGDINGDGILDIVTANQADNTVSILLGSGDATFRPQTTFAVGPSPESVAVADLNGDGHLDVVTTDRGGITVSVLLNNGDGTFQPAVNDLCGIAPVGLAVGDVNGDGHPDIVTANPSSNDIHVLLNNGDGTFGHLESYFTGTFDKSVAIANITSDGRPDIVTANQHGNTISLLPGKGDGTFPTHTEYGSGAFPFALAIADINGDNRLDVITANNYENAVGILRWTGSDAFTPKKGFLAGTAPVAVSAGDVNNDGRPDLITADFNQNTINVLLNQTTFVPLVPTATTLAVNQNPVAFHNRLELSVHILPLAASAIRIKGVVQFFDGDAVIGNALVSKTGSAHVFVAKLAVGSHLLSANYVGNATFASARSSVITQEVIPVDQAMPFIVPTITAARLPAKYRAGYSNLITLGINNTGAGSAVGGVTFKLYASTNGTLDATALPVAVSGSGNIAVRLAGGRSKFATFRFALPAPFARGSYTLFAVLAPVNLLTESQVSPLPVTSLQPGY